MYVATYIIDNDNDYISDLICKTLALSHIYSNSSLVSLCSKYQNLCSLVISRLYYFKANSRRSNTLSKVIKIKHNSPSTGLRPACTFLEIAFGHVPAGMCICLCMCVHVCVCVCVHVCP